MLLTFLCLLPYEWGMEPARTDFTRPDVVAAIRGGDPNQPMDGEEDPGSASMEQAVFWSQIYSEILVMEEQVLERIQHLMAKQSPRARREVEVSNVPVIAAQADRFRQRLGFWTARLSELELASSV